MPRSHSREEKLPSIHSRPLEEDDESNSSIHVEPLDGTEEKRSDNEEPEPAEDKSDIENRTELP